MVGNSRSFPDRIALGGEVLAIKIIYLASQWQGPWQNIIDWIIRQVQTMLADEESQAMDNI